MDYERRQVLTLGSAAAIAALAGCSGSDSADENGAENGDENGEANGTENGDENGAENGDENGTENGDANGTENGSENGDENGAENGDENGDENGSEDAVPGRDVLGGPDSLQSSAEVDAITLDADQGAGQYVNTPAVVWLEPGGEITWSIKNGAHSVTAYHPDYEKQMRIPESAQPFDSGTLSGGETFSHTFETEGVYNYFCRPHEGLGMVGLVIVGQPGGGPGTTAPGQVEASTAAENLSALLDVARIDTDQGGAAQSYGWQDATWDSYWYSLYNMSTNIAMSGNGITFPATDQQQEVFQQRFPEMLATANQPGPPVKNPNLNMAPFTEGDPHFTEQPVLSGDDGRPDAATLQWDKSKSSGVVSPSSLAWTHLKGVTWAKNFQKHFDVLPDSLAAEFRSMVLSTLAQVGTVFGLVTEQGGGNFRLNDENLLLGSEFQPGQGLVDETPAPRHHSSMLWFLSNLNSLAQNGWYGYVNPEPLIPAQNIQMLTNGMGKTTMNAFSPGDISNTRLAGELLGAVGWFGTQTNNDKLRQGAVQYANGLANVIANNLEDSGRVGGGTANQAATQGIVGQGLVWASELDGVDHTDTAETVLGYLADDLWDGDAGTFRSGVDDDVYTISARDAGDITGGINAAETVLGMDVKDKYARYFNQTMNRGRLQRAERPPSRDENAEYTLPLPPMAGGENGQAAVYNAEVEYDTGADEWAVTDDSFDTEASLYLANQEIWISQWSGDFYQGRGRPGHSDTPPQ